MKRRIIQVSKKQAIRIAADHNCVPIETAERFTDSELREVLHHLKLKADF